MIEFEKSRWLYTGMVLILMATIAFARITLGMFVSKALFMGLEIALVVGLTTYLMGFYVEKKRIKEAINRSC